MWDGLSTLEELWLSSNQIKLIEAVGFRDLSELKIPDLSKNQLTTLSEDILAPEIIYESSSTLHLNPNDNPLHCDQKMCWLKDARMRYMKLTGTLTCENYPGRN